MFVTNIKKVIQLKRLPLIEGLSGKRGEVPFEKLDDLMVDIK